MVLPAAVPREGIHHTAGGEAHIVTALVLRPGYIICEHRHYEHLLAQIAEHKELDAPCTVIAVDSTRKALAELARAAFDTDTHCPTVVGITGTNGKTTETYLLEQIFTHAGHSVGVIGTVEYRWPGVVENASLTTPGCLLLHSLLSRMYKAGVTIVFMEVASHALDQERIAGVPFAAALLTNITQDHLDYHGSMDAYFQAKARLFHTEANDGVPLDNKVCVCNADDPFGRTLLAEEPNRIGYGLRESAVSGSRHLHGNIHAFSPAGMTLHMRFEGKEWELSSPLVGQFNAMNLLGAQALALGLGLTPASFAPLTSFTGVRGRLERVPNQKGLHIFIDYAHTPDALVNVLTSLRAAGFARLVAVFGCGGNRDSGKRPLMGAAVAQYADVAVLTSDNPRNEEPEAIINDVLPGLASCREVHVNPDRRAALAHALTLIGPNDALLVAGKGHETYQIIKGIKYPFSDHSVVQELLA